MLAEERRTKILQVVGDNGSATVVDLSDLMHVSLMTVRRDINQLATDGLVFKTHGGVLPLRQSTTTEPVTHDVTVLLDEGSTTYPIAVNLRNKRNLTLRL